MHNFTVTETACAYCGDLFERKRAHGRFCSDRCRVYYGREGGPDVVRPHADADHDAADQSIGTAITAAGQFTAIPLPDHKTVAAIQVDRQGPAPATWSVRVPTGSVIAATRIHQALVARIDDLVSLANKLGAETGEPRLTIRTGKPAKRGP